MPADRDSSEYIPEFIVKFHALCKKPFIKFAYKSGVQAFSQHPGLMTQISDDGNYWYVIENAVQKDVIFKSNNCLSEVLKDNTIKAIVPLMFGVEEDSIAWTDSIKMYAFGH